MAKMNSKFKYMFDAAPAITLRAKSAAALTADGNTDAIVLDQLDGYWNPGVNLADQTFAVVVNIDALETGDDETYALSLVFGDDASFTNNVTTHTIAPTTTGQYVFLVDFDTVVAMLAGTTRMRIAVDVTASTGSPSIDFHAFIAGAIIR